MSKATHIIAIVCYVTLAATVGYTFPGGILNFEDNAAWLLAAVILICGLLAQETISRRQNEAKWLNRLLVLRRAYDGSHEELQRTRDEVRRVYEAMENVGRNAAEGGRELEEVASEVKVLHALVEELYSSGGGNADHALPPLPRNVEAKDAIDNQEVFGSPTTMAPVRLSETDMLDIIRDALRQNRVELYLQPIVSLPQRKHRYFECFSAVRNAQGAIITPDRYIEIAKKSGLIKAIDNMLLFRCIQLVKQIQKHDYATSFFCNVSPTTRADREFFQEFREFLERNEDMAPSIVFEFSQADIAAHPEEVIEDVERLRDVGYRFCMDQIVDLDFDAEALSELGFHFVKVEANNLLPEDHGSEDELSGNVLALKRRLDSAGIDLIVEKIETEKMLLELLDYNIDYGQGYLFGEPRKSQDPTEKPLTAGERA
ncbi:MAG: Cyclic di-GMP phosphodiesterase YfgF [Alphaproteobacteria bacterium MarineAlpha4_Bin2]|nr:MAG: Cyclic di-GMP phosphodiesterase YfgF [Alphaproteobacteria bacterium MarineAlpha4_Bin2]